MCGVCVDVCSQALDWCIASAALFSTIDTLGSSQHNNNNSTNSSSSSSSDVHDQQQHQIQQEMETFLARYPPPSEEDVDQLHQLTENMEDSQWVKDNAAFAYHRVTEVKERFACYTKLLDQQQTERQEQTAAASQDERLPGEDGGVVVVEGSVPQKDDDGVVIVVLGEGDVPQKKNDGAKVALGVSEEDEPDGVFVIENKAIRTWDSEEDLLGGGSGGGVTLRHPHKAIDGQTSSLLYDDVGVGHAMKLLQSVAQSADAKLRPLSGYGEEGREEG